MLQLSIDHIDKEDPVKLVEAANKKLDTSIAAVTNAIREGEEFNEEVAATELQELSKQFAEVLKDVSAKSTKVDAEEKMRVDRHITDAGIALPT
eukprot:gene38899-27871_t